MPLEPGGPLELLGRDGLVLLPAQPGDPVLALDRPRLDLPSDAQPHPGAGLVHDVDGLVRQEAVADVAVGQLRGRDQRVVGEPHLVVRLVGVAQPLQDLDRLLDRGFGHQHRLEASFERGVLLDVPAVLVEGGGADDVQFAARESGLEHVAGVHRALAGGARAHDGVQFVDEQDDPALGLPHLLDHLLEPLLELPAVLRARDQAGEVQGDDAPVLEGRRARRRRRCAGRGPSTIAVLPTPGSPISTGLFLERRERISIVCSISSARPTTGSSPPALACSVRSRPYSSRVGRLPRRPRPVAGPVRPPRAVTFGAVGEIAQLGDVHGVARAAARRRPESGSSSSAPRMCSGPM